MDLQILVGLTVQCATLVATECGYDVVIFDVDDEISCSFKRTIELRKRGGVIVRAIEH